MGNQLDMIRRRIPKLPRFTVTGLLFVTFATAVGFAVSAAPRLSGEDPNGFSAFGGYMADKRWVQGMQATAGVLLCYELVRQALLLLRLTISRTSSAWFATRLSAATRVVLAGLIGVTLAVRVLINRQLITSPDNPDVLQVWTQLWPDFLQVAAMLAAVRILLADLPQGIKPATSHRSWQHFALGAAVVLGVATIAAYVIIDRLSVSALVHMAVDGIEKSQAIWKHRPGTYPNHLSEGYRSFWCSVAATIAVLIATCLLLLDLRAGASRRQAIVRTTYLMVVLGIATYVCWFNTSEFPRLSPDLASVGSARLWTDTVAGVLLWLGLGAWIGTVLAHMRGHDVHLDIKPAELSIFAVLAAIIIAVSQIGSLVETARELLSITRLFTQPTLVEVLGTLGTLLVWPETLVPLVLLVSTLALLWQIFRRRNEPRYVRHVRVSDWLWYTTASLVLLAVAVPTLAAFGFCFWLGPFI